MISEYSKEDIKEIIDLGVLLSPKFKELFKIEKLSSNEKIYVYKNNNKVLGFLHILNNIDVIEILNIVILEEYRHTGIASLLLDYLLSEASPDISRILLEVKDDNEAAIKLYKKFNFMVINERSGYYGNNNALVMERRNNV